MGISVKFVKYFNAVAILGVVLIGSVSTSHGWWNNQWQYRKKISFDTTVSGADVKENLNEVTVLLQLHSGNFNFTNAKTEGDDLRFVSADDQTLLKHHIERFDTIDNLAAIWVKVPRISGGGSQDFIWMYYGNEDAMGGQDARGTYDPGYVAVFHFAEIEGNPEDASAYENHPAEFSGGLGLPGTIGNGLIMSGAGDHIRITDSPSLLFENGFTLSVWLKIAQAQENAVLFTKGDENQRLTVGVDGTKIFASLQTNPEEIHATEKVADLSVNNWHHLSVVLSPAERLSIYLDGLEMTWIDMPAEMPIFKGDVFIGSSGSASGYFVGDMDEIKVSSLARSEAWIIAQYKSQMPGGTLAALGVEEVGGGGGGLPVFYLATVFKNITLDGWVIIGLLLFLSFASWMIMISKTFTLWIVGSGNREFRQAFAQAQNPLKVGGDADDFENSALFRIHREGYESLKPWVGNPDPAPPAGGLTVNALNSFKVALEKGLMQESRRLNAWLVVLTMSITGGPFLGLLGTVWGVMNTFAAMAEAGEANIMAIAPGVASALSTTVFGLIVAIPALFGYNFLSGKIRNITADMNAFADEYTLKVEQTYGGNCETKPL